MSEISNWMDNIKEAVWTAFGESSSEVMNSWTASMVLRMKSGNSVWPVEQIGIKTGKLSNALQGGDFSSDEFIKNENQIVRGRTVTLPYANISNEGGTVVITERMKAYLLAKAAETKERKYRYMAFAKGGVLKHKKFDFVKIAVDDYSVEQLSADVMPYVVSELNKVPNIEVTVGN